MTVSFLRTDSKILVVDTIEIRCKGNGFSFLVSQSVDKDERLRFIERFPGFVRKGV